ncbi:MAG: ribonuclease HII [Clostridiales bacterium]|jgi:ribonuclease HII|nr:ribonuclease HII [Clostridiales bacterium]
MNKQSDMQELRELKIMAKNYLLTADDVSRLALDERPAFQLFLADYKDKLGQEQKRLAQLLYYENQLQRRGIELVAGVDEAGRGPLAGPVVAAAVIPPPEPNLLGLNDSKKLSEKERYRLEPLIKEKALAWAIAEIDNQEIDRINIKQASRLAMLQAVQQLKKKPHYLLIDAERIDCPLPQNALIKGDSISLSIAAASVLAKCHRDRLMLDFHQLYPRYGFDIHKGYPTALHRERLIQYGPSPIHRQSFAVKPPSHDQRKNTGQKGEDLTAIALLEVGYQIIERNYRRLKGEIDIVAAKDDSLYFVEVRSKTGDTYGDPKEAFTMAKRRQLKKIAGIYLAEKSKEQISKNPCYFLFAAVTLEPGETKVEIIADNPY